MHSNDLHSDRHYEQEHCEILVYVVSGFGGPSLLTHEEDISKDLIDLHHLKDMVKHQIPQEIHSDH